MEKLKLFYKHATGVEFGDMLRGPITFGGPDVKHFVNTFKLYGEFKYEDWYERAIAHLAGTTQRFPGPIQMYQLSAPDEGFGADTCKIWLDNHVCIREVTRQLPETWTEPAEDVDPDTFETRLVHPECTEVRFDMVFKFKWEPK